MVANKQDTARLKIGLMTSLPILWGEANGIDEIISQNPVPAAVYSKLQKNHDVQIYNHFDALEKNGLDMFVLAQPRGLTPHEFSALDKWVRAGGKALILADPHLAWPSKFAIGDKRRPLFTTLLSPLFKHWGFELIVEANENIEPQLIDVEGFVVLTAGTGKFVKDQSSPEQTDCLISNNGIVIDCEIGKGRAVVLADADFVDERLWLDETELQSSDPSAEMKSKAGGNIKLLMHLLQNLAGESTGK